ncbi:MAG: DNA repair protein RecO [Acidobacteria bacterium]|nr:DNA repair protein RecO [Acidobacteriota bacterium]MBV9623425.1 DNA repair protein RecO [Acidobacteriota bacterium]
MSLKQSEAIVLRTYPFRESDLLVTVFTRLEGKVRGVARAAKKSRRRFGGALEPLTQVKATYEDRERQELARLDACEVLESPLTSEVTYPRAVALEHVAELLDELLPDREVNDAVYRLVVSVVRQLRGDELSLPLTYFELWMACLMGYLPDLSGCIVCGCALNGTRAYFHALCDGLMCPQHKRLASSEMSAASRQLATHMLHTPLASLNAGVSRRRSGDLRKFLLQIIERHIEKKLVTRTMLERLSL